MTADWAVRVYHVVEMAAGLAKPQDSEAAALTALRDALEPLVLAALDVGTGDASTRAKEALREATDDFIERFNPWDE